MSLDGRYRYQASVLKIADCKWRIVDPRVLDVHFTFVVVIVIIISNVVALGLGKVIATGFEVFGACQSGVSECLCTFLVLMNTS